MACATHILHFTALMRSLPIRILEGARTRTSVMELNTLCFEAFSSDTSLLVINRRSGWLRLFDFVSVFL
jgi:hypothetical protein